MLSRYDGSQHPEPIPVYSALIIQSFRPALNDTGGDLQGGNILTRKPGAVLRENCSVAASAIVTKGSSPSLTSYPWDMRKMIAPAVLWIAALSLNSLAKIPS